MAKRRSIRSKTSIEREETTEDQAEEETIPAEETEAAEEQTGETVQEELPPEPTEVPVEEVQTEEPETSEQQAEEAPAIHVVQESTIISEPEPVPKPEPEPEPERVAILSFHNAAKGSRRVHALNLETGAEETYKLASRGSLVLENFSILGELPQGVSVVETTKKV